MKKYLSFFLRGIAMGTANVVPGVSGGTIALITGIFERLINAIKSFNLDSLKLLFSGKFKKFSQSVDLYFLLSVFTGIGVAIITIAKLFDFLFQNYPVYIWSFFFGLIIASIYYVGKTVRGWNISLVMFFLIGTIIAVCIAFGTPLTENKNIFYLFICGIVAACSMILPGLSGSFVLLLMGNYELVMIKAVTELNLVILLPVLLGAIVGLLGFSYILSWLFRNYRDKVISILTGFIFGSLPIIWPWKENITQNFGDKVKIIGYNWLLPQINYEFFFALLIILLGILVIIFTEKMASKK